MEHKDTDCEIIHADVVDRVRAKMPKDMILNVLLNQLHIYQNLLIFS